MLVKLEDGSFFNFDYVVRIYIVPAKAADGIESFLIRSNMIDGKLCDLAQYQGFEEAKRELRRLVKDANHDRVVVGRN